MEGELMGHQLTEQRGLRLWNSLVRFLGWSRAKDVEDVASETFVRLLQNLKTGEEIENLEGYVRQIARNVLKEQHRQGRRESALVQDPPVVFSPATPSSAETLLRQLEQCKNSCLSPKEAALVEAYYGAEPAQKIAQRKALAAKMCLSENALRLQAFRVRRKLLDCMKGSHQPNFERNGSVARSLSNKRDARA